MSVIDTLASQSPPPHTATGHTHSLNLWYYESGRNQECVRPNQIPPKVPHFRRSTNSRNPGFFGYGSSKTARYVRATDLSRQLRSNLANVSLQIPQKRITTAHRTITTTWPTTTAQGLQPSIQSRTANSQRFRANVHRIPRTSRPPSFTRLGRRHQSPVPNRHLR